jgi:putative solute:sodium symporter small subunit
MSRSTEDSRVNWRNNLRLTAPLLAIWLLAGPVFGIVLVDWLNGFRIGGVPLGFWVSLQGSIYVFVVLIFLYAVLSDRAERSD